MTSGIFKYHCGADEFLCDIRHSLTLVVPSYVDIDLSLAGGGPCQVGPKSF